MLWGAQSSRKGPLMNDLTTGELVGITLACLALSVLVGWYLVTFKSREKSRDEAERYQRELEERESQPVKEPKNEMQKSESSASDTHDKYGHRLCITCSDTFTRATQRPFLIVQSEGFKDLISRWFGAPARYKVKQSTKTVQVYCEECAALLYQEHESYILAFEQQMRDARRDATVQLRRWVKIGCNEAARYRLEQYEKDIKRIANKPPAKVVPLHSNGQQS